MKRLVLSLFLIIGLTNCAFSQGTQILSYGYPLQTHVYYPPVVTSIPHQTVVVNGVIIDTTPRVTVIAPPVIIHPVPVIIQPVVVPQVHRCWWPRPWVYNY